MKAKYKVLLIAIMSTGFAFAISSNELSTNIGNLVTKINQVNSDLNKKQKQQKSLDSAIGDSEGAINQSEQLLNHLQQKKSLDVKQLQEVATMLPQITEATSSAESSVKDSINKIYQQIRVVENSSQSILSGNDVLQNERKKVYLVQLLKLEKNKYIALQGKLNQLNTLNNNLQLELTRLNAELDAAARRKQQLELLRVAKIKASKGLQAQITVETTQLNNLKQTQAELNRLLVKIAKAEALDKKSQAHSGLTKPTNLANTQMNYENNSPFLKRKLNKPVAGDVAVSFGVIRNGVPNHGLLFTATNSAVYAISNGKVVYSGKLPGFGQILVVDNGDNYVSIYGGVVPMVNRGQQVSGGQVIANSGSKDNQPMGGVYFELRHLGRPVNPTSLIN